MIRLVFKHQTGVLLLTLVLAACGIWLLGQLPVLMYPQTQRPQVSVRLNHPGLSALDFQAAYAERVESRLLALDHLELMSSTYSSDSSSWDLLFDWNIKSADARSAVEAAMTTVNSLMPDDLQDSWTVRYREGENAGYLVLGILSDSSSPEQLYQQLVAGVEPSLGKVPDVEDIGIYNVEELKADITLRPEAMLARGITINDVQTALQTGFATQPVGTLTEGDQRFSVRHLRRSTGLASLYQLEVKQWASTSVRLTDIADIDIRYTTPRQVFLVGTRPAVQLTATPVEGGNLTRMSASLIRLMEEARDQGRLPADTEFVFYLDPAKYIQRSIDNVVQSALLGGALAILIVFLVLGEVRNTLIVSLSIPLSITLNFILMYAFGMTLNLISLGGLALAVGMIVDSTIVVTENIHRWRAEANAPLSLAGWQDMVAGATNQVQNAVIGSTLTSVLVFLPIAFTAPLANAILGDQARTVMFSLLCSMVVSLTIVPVLAWLLFRNRRFLARVHEPPRGLAWLSSQVMAVLIRGYRRLLGLVIHRRTSAVLFLLLAAAALAGCLVWVLPGIPRELMATPESDRVVLFFRNDAVSDTTEVVEQVLPGIQERLDACLGTLKVQSFANIRGRMNQIFIDLASPADSADAIARLQKEFVSGGTTYYNVMAWDPAALPLPMTNSLQVSVHGPDASTKVGLLDRMQRLINDSQLYRRSFTRPSPATINELVLTSRNETMGRIGTWSESSLLSLVRRVLGGTASTNLTIDGVEVSVGAKYPASTVDSREKLERFLVPAGSSFVPLKHFFNFTTQTGVSQIYSEDGELVYRLYASLAPGASDSQILEAQQATGKLLEESLELPPGYSWSFDNPRVEMDNALSSLYLALGISVLLMYLLLAWQFNSLTLPLIILLTIPLGLIGVILALSLAGSVLNLNSLLGTILLGGIVVNNAIILIDFYLQLKGDHEHPVETLVMVAGMRFQPILITTLTTIIGMLPLAIGMGGGSSILQPLGVAVAGGLSVSTLLTLFAVPAVLRIGLGAYRRPGS